MLKPETQITINAGCADFLITEIESLRRQNEILIAEKRIVDGFFNMVDRLQGKPSQGYGEDRLWQAKKEIREAKEKAGP